MTTLKIFEFNSFAEHCYIAWDANDCQSGHKKQDTASGTNPGSTEKKCLVIDPGCYGTDEKEELFTFLEDNSLIPEAVFLTHAHPDHCFGVAAVCRKYGVPVYMNTNESVTLSVMHKLCLGMGAEDVEDFSEYTHPINDGDELTVGPFKVKALFTPGHSAGGMCYLVREAGKEGSSNCGYRSCNDREGVASCNNGSGNDGVRAILFSGDTLFAGCIGRSDLPGGDYDKLMESIFTKLLPLDGDTDVLPGHGYTSTISDERMKNPFLLPFNEPVPDSDSVLDSDKY